MKSQGKICKINYIGSMHAHQVSGNESHFKHLTKKTICRATRGDVRVSLKAQNIILRDHTLCKTK